MSELDIQTSPVPTVESYDQRGSIDHPFGYVYFAEANFEGDAVRVGYVGGDEGDAPFLFQANWGDIHLGHLASAWHYLAQAQVAGFTTGTPGPLPVETMIRLSHEDRILEQPAWIVLEGADREFKTFKRRLKAAAKKAKAAGAASVADILGRA